jgi:hypothetical protein
MKPRDRVVEVFAPSHLAAIAREIEPVVAAEVARVLGNDPEKLARLAANMRHEAVVRAAFERFRRELGRRIGE